MHCSLHRSLDFASSRILPKTCPALSWDQALLSFSWVNRFQAGKANWKVPRFIVQYLCTCNVHSRDYRDIRWTLNSNEGLRGHIPCILVVQHGNSKNVDSFGKNLATQLKECRWSRVAGWRAPFRSPAIIILACSLAWANEMLNTFSL